MTGMKHDKGKPMLGLVPPLTATRIARVMAECVERTEAPYAINSWRNVKPVTRYLDALERHVEAIKDGELIDLDSGLPHIDHVLTNAAFLAWFHARGTHPVYPLHTPEES
tara:strand:- start:1106 stop:1435 length:330 start_codon:yes stop_codon:yes gene_type:complete